MFVDSHAHLEMPQFDADRDAMLARAHEAAIETVVAIGSGTGPGSLDCAIQLANREKAGEPRIYATVGIHPHEAKLATDADFDELSTLARNPKVIAWGEIGLDYFYDHSPREVQRSVFLKQLELARAARLPVVIHCRPSAGQPERLGRVPRHPRRTVGAERAGRHPALLYGPDGACAAGARPGLHDLLRRQRDLPQGAEHPRCGAGAAARPHLDRNRFSVPGAGTASRQAQ